MGNKVLITISDRHEVDGEIDSAEIQTIGTFSGTEDDYTLKYSEAGELEGCEVSLNVKDGKTVTMTRSGEQFSTQLIIELNKRHNCFYRTPAGEMMLGVFASEVSSDVTEDGGKVRFKYTLDFNAGLVSENELEITVENV